MAVHGLITRLLEKAQLFGRGISICYAFNFFCTAMFTSFEFALLSPAKGIYHHSVPLTYNIDGLLENDMGAKHLQHYHGGTVK